MNAHPGQLQQDHDLVTVEAEQGLLGALLIAPDSYLTASAIIKPEYFSQQIHAQIYDAISQCRAAGRKARPQDIRQYLGDAVSQELGEGVSVGSYLVRLVESATGTNAADHARSVRDLWALRTVEQIAASGSRNGLPEQGVKSVFDQLDALRMSIEEQATTRASVSDVVAEVVTQAARIAGGQEEEPGVTTGLPELDKAMLGFRPGELVIVAGRPGMGKSTFATSIALMASDTAKEGRRGGVGFFAFELGRQAIGARMAADLISADRYPPAHSNIRSGRLAPENVLSLEESVRRASQCSLIIDSRSSATVGEIEAACLAMRRKFEKQGRRLDVIFIDYIKQVRATDRYRGNKVYEIGEITYGLRDIAKRLQICVVLLVQLNRAVESRDNKRPTLADLRESGDIENDADVVALLYRPAYYLRAQMEAETDDMKQAALRHELSKVENELEIILTKNRNGDGGFVVRAFCDIARSAIRPLDWKYGTEAGR